MTQTKLDGHNRDVGNDWQFNLKTSLLLHFCPKCKDQKLYRSNVYGSTPVTAVGHDWMFALTLLAYVCVFDIQINVYMHFDYDELK